MADYGSDEKPHDGKPDDVLAEALEAFKLCEEREADNRAAALEDLKFGLLDEQWDDDTKKKRDNEGRPCLTTNLLKPIATQVKNEARQNRPQIKVHPVDSAADPHTAVIINGLIRNIEATSRADQAYDIALASAVDGGWGYFRINTGYACDDSFDLDLVIQSVPNPFSVYGDPYSSAADSSDWNVAFVAELMPRKVFEDTYKGADPVDWKSGAYSELKLPWCEGEQVRVAEWWTREKSKRKILLLSSTAVVTEDIYRARKDEFDALGLTVAGEREIDSHKVRQRIMTGAEVLEERDWLGKYIPVVPVYGNEVNIEGKRYWRSFIASAKDAQRKYNAWDSAATELAALAPKAGFIGPKGSFVSDVKKWSTINTDAWAFVEYDVVPGQPAPFRPQVDFAGAAAALQQAASAANDIKAITGVHEPGLGAPLEQEASGKALLQLQKRGDTSTFNYGDNQSRAIEHAGRILLDLIPQIYSGKRVIRVLGPAGERLPGVKLGEQTPIIDAKGRPLTDDNGAQIMGIYDLGAGKYDLDVEPGPSHATQRQESADALIEIIRANPAAAGVLGDVLVKLLDIQDADEIAERLKALLPAELRGQDPKIQELTQALEQVKAQGAEAIQALKDELRTAQTAAMDMQVKLDTEKQRTAQEARKLEIDAYNASTTRLKALAPKGLNVNTDPEAVAQVVHQVLSHMGNDSDIDQGGLSAFATDIDGRPFQMPQV